MNVAAYIVIALYLLLLVGLTYIAIDSNKEDRND